MRLSPSCLPYLLLCSVFSSSISPSCISSVVVLGAFLLRGHDARHILLENDAKSPWYFLKNITYIPLEIGKILHMHLLSFINNTCILLLFYKNYTWYPSFLSFARMLKKCNKTVEHHQKRKWKSISWILTHENKLAPVSLHSRTIIACKDSTMVYQR